MRQEEEQGGKLAQHDQWYWSMVSVIVNGTTSGTSSMTMVSVIVNGTTTGTSSMTSGTVPW